MERAVGLERDCLLNVQAKVSSIWYNRCGAIKGSVFMSRNGVG